MAKTKLKAHGSAEDSGQIPAEVFLRSSFDTQVPDAVKSNTADRVRRLSLTASYRDNDRDSLNRMENHAKSDDT
jgi:hypothetical protein